MMFYCDGVQAGEPPAHNADLAARAPFQGERRGELRLQLGLPAAHSLAGGFLGKDPAQVTAGEAFEVAAELANMVCGCYLSKMGSGGSFVIGQPERVLPSIPPHAAAALHFVSDCGPIEVALTIDPL